jgi:hypothetical protein
MCIPLTVAKQRLGKHVTAATIIHATIEQLLDKSLSMRSVPYQRKVGNLNRRTPVRELHVAFKIHYTYDSVIKLCRKQA